MSVIKETLFGINFIYKIVYKYHKHVSIFKHCTCKQIYTSYILPGKPKRFWWLMELHYWLIKSRFWAEIFGNFLSHNTQKTILHEVRFDSCEVKLNQTLENSKKGEKNSKTTINS